MNHKILLSYLLVIGFFICLVFAYMKYSNNLVESESDRLRQNLASVLDKEVNNLQSQIDGLKSQVSGGATFDQLVENYLRNHPELLTQILENFYKDKKALENKEVIESSVKKILEDLAQGKITSFAGDIKAPIKIVEFFDYSCSFCSKMTETKKKILEEKDVAIIYLDLPILGPESLEASKVGLAVSLLDPSKYPAFQETVLETAEAKTRDNLLKIAQSLGINIKELQKVLEKEEDKIETRLKENSLLAQELQLQGTPSYFLGDQSLVGAVPYEKFLEVIKRERERIKNTDN